MLRIGPDRIGPDRIGPEGRRGLVLGAEEQLKAVDVHTPRFESHIVSLWVVGVFDLLMVVSGMGRELQVKVRLFSTQRRGV